MSNRELSKVPAGLAAFAGRSNTEELWAGLIGETIAAVFEVPSATRVNDGGTEIWLVMESGYAFVYRRPNGAFWVANKEDVERHLSRQRNELETAIGRLGRLGTMVVQP